VRCKEEHFARLANGQHPLTGEQLVRYQAAREYVNERGETITTMEHRAGWDATFSAPKSVSLTALVGGDEEVRQAHRESVKVALDELEKYVQARIGGNHPAETTGKWVAASFEHDSARPVDGYAAPQVHTHVVFFNLTETENGETRALQPHELYRSQQYATAIYRSELALRLKDQGYEIEQGKSGQPEIKGYTRVYLEASSPVQNTVLTVQATDGLHTWSLNFTLNIGDFSIAISPPVQQTFPTGVAGYMVTLTSAYGFNGAVSLSCSGLPSGVACPSLWTLSPSPTGAQYQLLLNIQHNQPANYGAHCNRDEQPGNA
jgi:conjugative relaxase-like TrwC/TraI family protein